jgi:hypothetical protein
VSIYSTRFVKTDGSTVQPRFVVPAGTRAVVRSFTATRWSSTASAVYLAVAGIGIYSWSGAVQYSSVNVDVRHVAYAGESIELLLSSVSDSAMVSGYLFQESGARIGILPAPADPPLWAPPALADAA